MPLTDNNFMESRKILGPYAARVKCPNCNSFVITDIKISPGKKAWMTGLLICILG